MECSEVKLERPDNEASTDNIPTFLSKTFEILENLSYQDIISWTKNGQGFVVKKVKEFSQRILPLHFRHNNYSSFVRQLNMYDFHKMRQDNQENAFKNSLFKRGCRHLLKQIQRKDYKKNKQMRVQINNGQPIIQGRMSGSYSELSSLNKEIDIQLDASRSFHAKSTQTCLSVIAQFQKQGELLNRLTQIAQQPSSEGRLCQLTDAILKLKREVGQTGTHLDCFYDDWSNFLAKKNIKWSSLMPEQRRPQQRAVEVKSMNFPTWATSFSSYGGPISSMHRLPE